MRDRPSLRTFAPARGSLRSIAECCVVVPGQPWEPPADFHGIIADVALDRAGAREILRRLTSNKDRARQPLICLTRDGSEANPVQARTFGATACLSSLAEPRHIVGTLARCIWPEKSLADLVISREAARAVTMMRAMFGSAASTGRIAMEDVDRTVDPVLAAIHEGGLNRWLDEVWTHDDVTFQHCLLVSGVAAAFAQHLRLPKPDCDLLTRAALVHDVGKSKIPHAILNKPDRLDADEQRVMREHPLIGFEILQASGGCAPLVLDITRHHHEMLDGSGYPDGLSGSEIADPVRLLTICDIYAALIEKRPYKAAMSTKDALSVLAAMNGKLEMALVGAFAQAVTRAH